MNTIAIIGGGAAGMTAAIRAAEFGASVTLFEKNPLCGKKLLITGKGRCNVTNASSVSDTERSIVRGGKFLRTALYAFPPDEVCAFFEENGVPLKVERGNRVFPVSDSAKDIADALIRKMSHLKVTLRKEAVRLLEKDGASFLVRTDRTEERFSRVLIATGGASYPGTGSTGDGYRFASSLGHRVLPPKPSLVPLTVREDLCRQAMGLSLKNCSVRFESASGKTVYEDFGELLFTHFGVSGPVILSASAFLDFDRAEPYQLRIDLKPALSFEQLDKRVLRDFSDASNRDLVNVLDRLLPQKLIKPILAAAGIEPHKKVNLVTRAEREALVSTVKGLALTVTGTRPLSEAIITRGGVALDEIDPRTMQSRLVPGLFFAGEILDADALTGGFNLQIAFSTAHLAGEKIAQEVL